jgi:acyl-coenzyme A synthetase/AMP-(fatty) acid ligase
MMGYATKLADLSKGDELQGVLNTGDIAQKDDEGFYYITGRIKRFIKIHGNRIGLDEVEHYLKSKGYDILCTGIDDKLMLATRDQTISEQIKQEIILQYGFHHSTIKVAHVETYPISSAGKIQYTELTKVFE